MEFKTYISSKGELLFPKDILKALGITAGAEVALSLRKDNLLEIKEVKGKVIDFTPKEPANNSAADINTSALTEVIIESSLM